MIDSIGGQAERGWVGEVAPTLKATHYKSAPCVMVPICTAAGFCPESSAKTRGIGYEDEMAPTLRAGVTPAVVYDARGNGDGKTANTLTGDHNNRITDYSSVVVEPKGYTMQGFGDYKNCDVASSLKARDYKDATDIVTEAKTVRTDRGYYIARRLTPTECARLQGFADQWGDIEKKDRLTEEEFHFWHEVRNTHAAINGKKVQNYTEPQILTWYNKLHTDSAEYKMWGNGIALPPALYCMQGIVDALNTEEDDWWML